MAAVAAEALGNGSTAMSSSSSSSSSSSRSSSSSHSSGVSITAAETARLYAVGAKEVMSGLGDNPSPTALFILKSLSAIQSARSTLNRDTPGVFKSLVSDNLDAARCVVALRRSKRA